MIRGADHAWERFSLTLALAAEGQKRIGLRAAAPVNMTRTNSPHFPQVAAEFLGSFLSSFDGERGVLAPVTLGFSGERWCCKRGLNSRPLPYQGSALPLSYCSYCACGLCHRRACSARRARSGSGRASRSVAQKRVDAKNGGLAIRIGANILIYGDF